MARQVSPSDLPSVGAGSIYAGFGSRFAHGPLWMCMGCATPGGPPVTVTSTLVFLSSSVSVRIAVPVSPELFWGWSVTLTSCAPLPGPGGDACLHLAGFRQPDPDARDVLLVEMAE